MSKERHPVGARELVGFDRRLCSRSLADRSFGKLLVPDKFQQHRIVAFLRSHSEMSQSEKRERRVFKLADPLPSLDQNASINVEDQQSKRGRCDG